MKNLKLKVGKTYRSWRGEEVTIVKYDSDSEDPRRYMGNDRKWYTEDGRFDYFFGDSLYDLVEEVKERK